MSQTDYPERLQQLLPQVGLRSLRELSRQAGVSRWQVQQLREGKALQMRGESLLKLSAALQIPLADLLSQFGEVDLTPQKTKDATGKRDSYQAEYQRLKTEMAQQREVLMQEFQQSGLQMLESWLKQWPKAVYAAQQNPQLAAANLLPLMRPVEELVKQWGVEAIAEVGSQVAYDPRWHQLTQGTAEPGAMVTVKSPGYRQGDRLLYRTEVSP
ncbi:MULTISPECIES: helix-turn-helix domain-containing protein [Planktothricoides]|uniref:Helix-turn-helix domain-containing protein n=2 Tax=Planktothricoides raciborskii TaxID=132608 RepID=A0AAU8J7W5_9CYAN|nr:MULTISPECIES: helix-turn-helix domain-containing protein [Planktothricoides]KOR36756.1 XRE family transcriptional regulator [Planktothricoides sp. SR001]MBD2547482.1 helix-turn-helix domain-containing protein [Planktothricoides raciborskii FACHB-1370]MBD2585989.1 helix-turn-helix domain-containing protein [Planktothricoides raciborskii FACHB-1261]